jgi:hypothetical protein
VHLYLWPGKVSWLPGEDPKDATSPGKLTPKGLTLNIYMDGKPIFYYLSRIYLKIKK